MNMIFDLTYVSGRSDWRLFYHGQVWEEANELKLAVFQKKNHIPYFMFSLFSDLNPNNILLSDNGSIKLTYFFRYPNVDPSLNLHAVERLYVAPEVVNMNSSITFAADWWSFGAILYELITLEVSLHNYLAMMGDRVV